MDQHVKLTMALTAENLAVKHNISREDCDRYALQSQQRWKAGWYREKNLVGAGRGSSWRSQWPDSDGFLKLIPLEITLFFFLLVLDDQVTLLLKISCGNFSCEISQCRFEKQHCGRKWWVVRSTGCSYREFVLGSQCPCSGSQSHVAPVSGDPIPASGLHGHRIHVAHICTGKT